MGINDEICSSITSSSNSSSLINLLQTNNGCLLIRIFILVKIELSDVPITRMFEPSGKSFTTLSILDIVSSTDSNEQSIDLNILAPLFFTKVTDLLVSVITALICPLSSSSPWVNLSKEPCARH